MSLTELDEVQGLLERVLPDPSGFAQRLLLQVMARLGQFAESGGSASHARANAFYSAAAAEDVTANETVTAADQPAADEIPIDINLLLAAALGACDCWGLRPDCFRCRGHGCAGWAEPDAQLFDEFVRPAMARQTGVSADSHEQDVSANADEASHNHQTTQGEDA